MTGEALDVARVLGVERVPSPLAFAEAVERGLPVAAVKRVVDAVAPGDAAFTKAIVPKATLARRNASAGKRLSADESNRVARIAKVWAFARRIFGDDTDAREFLGRPHMLLEGRRPRDVAAASDPGADLVVNLIGRGAYSGGV